MSRHTLMDLLVQFGRSLPSEVMSEVISEVPLRTSFQTSLRRLSPESSLNSSLKSFPFRGTSGDLENTILAHSNKHESFTWTHLIPLILSKICIGLRFYEGTVSVLCWKWWSNGESAWVKENSCIVGTQLVEP